MKIADLDPPFWLEPDEPAATRQMISDAESRLGCRFPSEYVDAMLLQNGGVSSYAGYRKGDYFVPLPALLSLDAVISAFDGAERWGTPSGIVVVATGAHEWLGFDYRTGQEPSIVYQEAEDAELEVVANSFAEFVAGLTED
jgi:hypothetical protein